MCIGDFLSNDAVMDYNTFVAEFNIKTSYLPYHGINKNAIQHVIKNTLIKNLKHFANRLFRLT